MSYEDLKQEVSRLALELQKACLEKVQAAEYGLAVLQEKEVLQNQYDDIKLQYDQVKEQLNLMSLKNEKLTNCTEQGQGNLLHEISTRESLLVKEISDLKYELKCCKKSDRANRHELEIHKEEFTQLHEELIKTKEKTEQLIHENKEYKTKEIKFNEDYNMLEEENTSLQKSISKLKQTLIEFEGMKVENKSLLDEIDSLQLQLQMCTIAKEQFEKQLHEALDTVREQRERNAQHLKEIHDLKQNSILKMWEIGRGEVFSSFEQEHPIVTKITEEYNTHHVVPSANLVDDLMKELQSSEIRELEEQLRQAQEEKHGLELQLTTKSNVAELEKNTSEKFDQNEYYTNNQLKELLDLKEGLKQYQSRELVYQLEIKQLSDQLEELKELLIEVENEKNTLAINSKDESKQFSNDLLDARSKLRESETKIKSMQEDMKRLKELTGEYQTCLHCAQAELITISQDLVNVLKKANYTGEIVTFEINNEYLKVGDPGVIVKLLNHVKQQEKALEIVCNNLINSNSGINPSLVSDQALENGYLKEQLLKCQSLLVAKREQISTLRTVLKANKATYEVALANLKSRYESDKAIQNDVSNQLKRQIKALKSECQTFVSLRSMFATRCDEYIKQLEIKDQNIAAAENEKQTLNILLKQAIHQKICLTQRLEEYEIARERIRQFTKSNLNKNVNKKPVSPTKPITRV
uniref:Protein bicaudal D homolog 2 n=1 Tax=Hydra vulgaris TaxID=6087 RepID=T2M8Z9_HYDVU